VKTARNDFGPKQPLTNESILTLGRILGQMIPDGWLNPIGSNRLIGESVFQALEDKGKGLSTTFRNYLIANNGKSLPEILAELFFAAERKIRWEKCRLCAGKGFKWRILGLVGMHCSHCKGKGGWLWFPDEGIVEEEAIPRLLPIHQPIVQEKEKKSRPAGW
jgi:hypothetical protein